MAEYARDVMKPTEKRKADVKKGWASLQEAVATKPQKSVQLLNEAWDKAKAGRRLTAQEIAWVFGMANLALQAAVIKNG